MGTITNFWLLCNAEQEKHLQEIRHNWPQIVPENVKQRIHRLFREETSSITPNMPC
jgi:hypothetical protein